MKRLQALITFLIALVSSNVISAYSDRRRISHNRRQLQPVLDTPLDPESEELSYANEEDEDPETIYKEDDPEKWLEEDEFNAADDNLVEEDDSFFGDDLIIEEYPPTPEPVEAPVPPTPAPTKSWIDETFESTPPPTESLVVAETSPPTQAPTQQNVLETSPPSPAPIQSIVIETAAPTLRPTKAWIAETPRPSPAPTMTQVLETPPPSHSPTQSPIQRKHRTPSPSQSPTQSPIKKKHPRTERPTFGGRDSSKPDEYDMWGKDDTFSHHATASPTTAPQEVSDSKNHALEKEAEEFVEDPYVRIATLVFAVVGVTLLILVAQQMVENPDGLCARLCRWSVAFFRMLCYPCLCCCGSRSKAHHTHTLVSTDGFDDYDHDLSLA